MELSIHDYEFPDGFPNIAHLHTLRFIQATTENVKGTVKKTFVLLTDFVYYLFEKKFFSNKLVLIDQMEFKDLAEVKFEKEPTRKLTLISNSRRQISILGNKAHQIADLFFKFINSIFMDYEERKPKISFPQYTILPKITKSIPLRLKYFLMLKGFTLRNSSMTTLAKFFASKPTELSLSRFTFLYQHIEMLLECIHWEKSIIKLTIPLDIFPKGVDIITRFMKTNNTIFELEFMDGKSSLFPALFTMFNRNINCRVQKLSFVNVPLSMADLQALDRTVTEYPISHISFKNVMEYNQALSWTKNSIPQTPNYAVLQSLILDNTPGISLLPIFKKMEDLKYLSIKNSKIDIGILIKYMQRPNVHIERINASSNQCLTKIVFGRNGPCSNIKFIDLSNIIWPVESLVQVWNFLAKSKISVDLSSAMLAGNSSWTQFYLGVQTRSSNISSLYWDENPADGIVNMLPKLKNLKGLSIARCFGEHDESVDKIADYIKKTKQLQYLLISGSRRKCLGADSDKIIDALTVNRSIKRLDLSQNRLSEEAIAKLGSVLMINRVVEFISIEGNSVEKFSVFQDLFKALEKRGKKLLITWPDKEIKAISLYSGTDPNEIEELMALHKKVAEGDPTIKIPPECLQLPEESP